MDNSESRLALFETLSSSLQVLSMKGLSSPNGLKDSFQLLDKLAFLDASECDIPSAHLFNGLFDNKGVEKNLKSLILNSFGISSTPLFECLVPSLKYLHTLELRNGHEGVTDQVVQAVNRHCNHLRTLVLSNCGQLTDAAFTGHCIDKELPEDIGNQGKIFLGSRAEAELIEEIKRMEYMNKTALTSAPMTSFGLKKLKRLEIDRVRITELSLNTFRFDDLRLINVSLCKSISDKGFKILSENNPHLETFIAKQCQISGPTLLHLAKNCSRLTTIDVEACLHICDGSVQDLPKFSTNLRFIDLSFCKNVKTATIENILMKKIPSLKSVGMRGLALAELLDDSDSETDILQPPMPPPLSPRT